MSVIEITGWSLIHFLWQGAAVYLGLWLILVIGKRLSASFRYVLCCIALFIMSLCPLITAAALQRGAAAPTLSLSEPATATSYVIESAPGVSAPPLGSPIPAEPMPRQLLLFVVILWFCGSGLCSLRLLAGLVGVGLMHRRGPRIDDSQVLKSVRNLSKRLGIRCPRLIASVDSAGPAAFGILRATISIPASLIVSLPADQLDALLAHELAHIRRHDYLINLWQSLVEALLFYHPAVWWVSNRIRAERELACDDLALSLLTDRRSYARALASLESLRTAPVAVAATGGDLLFRIRRILGEPVMRNRSTTSLAGGLAALVLLCGTVFVLNAKAQDAAVPRQDEAAARAAKEAAAQEVRQAETELKAAQEAREAGRAAQADANRARAGAIRARCAADDERATTEVIRARRVAQADAERAQSKEIRARSEAIIKIEKARDEALLSRRSRIDRDEQFRRRALDKAEQERRDALEQVETARRTLLDAAEAKARRAEVTQEIVQREHLLQSRQAIADQKRSLIQAERQQEQLLKSNRQVIEAERQDLIRAQQKIERIRQQKPIRRRSDAPQIELRAALKRIRPDEAVTVQVDRALLSQSIAVRRADLARKDLLIARIARQEPALAAQGIPIQIDARVAPVPAGVPTTLAPQADKGPHQALSGTPAPPAQIAPRYGKGSQAATPLAPSSGRGPRAAIPIAPRYGKGLHGDLPVPPTPLAAVASPYGKTPQGDLPIAAAPLSRPVPQRRRSPQEPVTAPALPAQATPPAEPTLASPRRRGRFEAAPETVPVSAEPMTRIYGGRSVTVAPPPTNGRILEDELERLELERINIQARMRGRNRDEGRGLQERLDTLRWKIGEIEKALARKRARNRTRSSLSLPMRLAQIQRNNPNWLSRYGLNVPLSNRLRNQLRKENSDPLRPNQPR